MALNLQSGCDGISSVTHFRDNYKLNIRRLLKEKLSEGIPEQTIICLDKVVEGRCHII